MHQDRQPLSLDSFENELHPTILERGFEYFENDQIQDVLCVGDNQFAAVAQGNYLYDVFIELKDTKLKAYDCSCPYDQGPMCKHLVGLLYHLKTEKLYLPENQGDEVKLDSRIDLIPDAVLRRFVKSYARYERKFRQAILDFAGDSGDNRLIGH